MNKAVARFDVEQDTRARFTTAEFLHMNASGAFDDFKVELIDGELERMNASQGAHARLQMRVGLRLAGVAEDDRIWGASGIDLGDATVVECDVVLLKVPLIENRWLMPSEILLVVEVSQTTTVRDMGLKRIRYATADIPYYWVIDTDRSVVHVYAEPSDGEYAQVHTVRFGEALAVPGTDRTIVID